MIPTKGSKEAAGNDLYAYCDEPIFILPYITVALSLMRIKYAVLIGFMIGLFNIIPYFGAIFARSGLATKNGLRPANCVGVCDEDYTGEYVVVLYNDSSSIRTVNPGDRIAQLVFLPYMDVDFCEVDELENTKRGDGGFGSTGR